MDGRARRAVGLAIAQNIYDKRIRRIQLSTFHTITVFVGMGEFERDLIPECASTRRDASTRVSHSGAVVSSTAGRRNCRRGNRRERVPQSHLYVDTPQLYQLPATGSQVCFRFRRFPKPSSRCSEIVGWRLRQSSSQLASNPNCAALKLANSSMISNGCYRRKRPDGQSGAGCTVIEVNWLKVGS
jgi:hypothetical protein